MFKKIPQVPTKDELLNKSFSKAREVKKNINPRDRVNSIREYESNKINTATTVFREALKKILDKTPNTDDIDAYTMELANFSVDMRQFKKSLAALAWAITFSKDLEIKYRRRLKGAELKDLAGIRSEYYGRLSSVAKQIKDDLLFLEAARKNLRKLPSFKNLPTVVLAGYPNVGKSSLMKSLTGADVRIESFPFTTKKVMLGYIDEKIQVIDTPGLLDRPNDKKNEIERQSMLALRHKANLIIFMLDPTESCGYKLEKQLALLAEIRSSFSETPFMVCMAKSDIYEKNSIPFEPITDDRTIFISAEKNNGIPELRKLLLRSVDWKTFTFRLKD